MAVPSSETIVALATPAGEGAVGIVRLSGPGAPAVASRIFTSRKGVAGAPDAPFRLTLGRVVDPESGEPIDEVLAVHMPAPTSYTGEDVIEFQAHGGRLILERILRAALAAGAQMAVPGEFTRRAFLNGRLDLSQAEAVIDLIRSRSDGARRAALRQLQGGLSREILRLKENLTELSARVEADLDFGEEEGLGAPIESRDLEAPIGALRNLLSQEKAGLRLREGLQVCVCGRTNVGKSSIVNRMLDSDRSIVTSHPGTTRDTVESVTSFGGLPTLFIDTAGFGTPRDPVEEEGIKRSRQKLAAADLAVVVLDSSAPLDEEDRALLGETVSSRSLVVLNKGDLPCRIDSTELPPLVAGRTTLITSAATGAGLEDLRLAIAAALRSRVSGDGSEDPLITNARHFEALRGALQALEQAQESVAAARPLEMVAADLRAALGRLGEIIGEAATEDLLDRIFAQFCIGK